MEQQVQSTERNNMMKAALDKKPNMAIAVRDHVPTITLRPFVYEWL